MSVFYINFNLPPNNWTDKRKDERVLPVCDATGVYLKVTEVAQGPLLNRNQIHHFVADGNASHASLKSTEGIFTFGSKAVVRTT